MDLRTICIIADILRPSGSFRRRTESMLSYQYQSIESDTLIQITCEPDVEGSIFFWRQECKRKIFSLGQCIRSSLIFKCVGILYRSLGEPGLGPVLRRDDHVPNRKSHYISSVFHFCFIFRHFFVGY